VLAKTAARRAGADEAWFVDAKGEVTEGASTNAWIVTANNVAVTRALHANILPGVTRDGVLKAARVAGIAVEERPFTVEEAKRAREAFITSATGGVIPVVEIDAQRIGNGAPGPFAMRLHTLYRELAAHEAEW
jgi:D-alanine transaminase